MRAHSEMASVDGRADPRPSECVCAARRGQIVANSLSTGIDEKSNKYFAKDRIHGTFFLFAEFGLARRTPNEERQWGNPPETHCTQLETRVDFFYFFCS
jgi:hypothetical protein